MSSMHRTLEGEVLAHDLTADARMIDPALLARTGRSARTLVKDGPLRLVIIALAAGAELPSHRADGPVTIQLLEGDVRFSALGREYAMAPGDVLVLAPRVEHAAQSEAGALFLLTLVQATTRDAVAADAPAVPLDSPPVMLTESARLRWQDDGGHRPEVAGREAGDR